MAKFSTYDIFVTVISALTFVADVGTDIWLMIFFYLHGHAVWGALTLAFIASGTLMTQIFSFYWHVTDRTLNWKTLILHMLFLAPLHRYCNVLHRGLKARKTGSKADLDAAYRELNDICILRLVETFFESAPQLVLQLYIIFINVENFGITLGVSTGFSLLSMAWAVTAYTDALHLAYKKFYKRNFIAILTHVLWQLGMMASRILAIVLFASVFDSLVFAPAGIHLLVMITWITFINPDFGSTQCEKRMFIFVSALIHSFCFLNLKDGPSRWRMFTYYALTLIENALLTVFWFLYKPKSSPPWLEGVAFGVVFGGFAFGCLFVAAYYSCCHRSGPAPIMSQKRHFHQQQPTAAVPQKLHGNQERYQAKPIFDVSSTSTRINLWLNASVDLSKDSGLDGRNLSGQGDGNRSLLPQSLDDNQIEGYNMSGYTRVTQADLHQSPGNMSAQSHRSPTASQPLMEQSPIYSTMYFKTTTVVGTGSNDGLDYINTGHTLHTSQADGDMNLVEMFQHCKLDPAYVSNSSIDDSVYYHGKDSSLSQTRGTHKDLSLQQATFSESSGKKNSFSQLKRNRSQRLAPYSNYISGTSGKNTSASSNMSVPYSRNHTPDSLDFDFPTTSISPLDASKLWEESQGRLNTDVVSPTQLQSRSNLSGSRADSRNNSTGIQSLTNSQGVSYLSLSYSTLDRVRDKTQSKSSWENSLQSNSALSLSASSFVFSKGRNSSEDGKLYYSSSSDPLSFSESSLNLPDSSNSYSNRKNRNNYRGIYQYSSDYEGSRLNSRGSRQRSSPSDIQSSSYFSDRGLSSSSSYQHNASHPSLTSSGFQSEDSNMGSLGRRHAATSSAFPYQSTPLIENEISTIQSVGTCRQKKISRKSTEDQDMLPVFDTPRVTFSNHPTVSSLQYSTESHTFSNHPTVSFLQDSTESHTFSTHPTVSSLQDSTESHTFSNHPTVSSLQDSTESHTFSNHPTVSSLQDSTESQSPQIDDSPVLPPLSVSSSRRASRLSESGRYFSDPSTSLDRDPSSSSDEYINPRSTSLTSTTVNSNSLGPDKSSLSVYLSDMSSRVSVRSSDETISTGSDTLSNQSSTHNIQDEHQKTLNKSRMDRAIREINRSLTEVPSRVPDYENMSDIPYADDSDLDLSVHSHMSDRSSRSVLSRKALSDCPWRHVNTSHLPASTETDKWDVYKELSQVSIVHSNSGEEVGHISDTSVPGHSQVPLDCMDTSPHKPGHNVEMFNRDRWRASLEREMQKKLEEDIKTCHSTLAPKKLYELQKKSQVKRLSPVEVTDLTESPYKFRRRSSSHYENIPVKTESPPVSSSNGELTSNTSQNSQKSLVYLPDSDTDTTEHMIAPVRGELYEEINNLSQSLDLSGTKSPINISGVNSAFKPVKPQRKSIGTPRRKSDTFTVHDETVNSNDSSIFSLNNKTFDKNSLSFLDRSNAGSRLDNSRRRSSASRYSCGVKSDSPFPWSETTDMSAPSVSNTPVNYLQLVGKGPLSFISSFRTDENTSHMSQGSHSYTSSIPWDENSSKNTSLCETSGVAPSSRQPLKALENTPEFSPIQSMQINGTPGRLDGLDTTNRKRLMSTPKVLNSNSRVSLSRVSVDSMSFGSVGDMSRQQSYGSESRTQNKTPQNNTSTWSSQQDFEDELMNNLEGNYDTFNSLYI